MNRDFKGVWIPKEIYLDERLSALDKIILAEIDSLDDEDKGCYASNQYLADFCQCSERKVTASISKLIEYGYVEAENFDGRHRVLRSRVAKSARQGSKKCEADTQKVRPNNIENTKNNKIDNCSSNNIYTLIVESYNSTCVSLPKCMKLTDKRKSHIKRRVADYGIDEIQMAFRKAEESDFLTGRKGEWKASFDWMMQSADNIAKILEGQYDNHGSTIHDKLKRAFEAIG